MRRSFRRRGGHSSKRSVNWYWGTAGNTGSATIPLSTGDCFAGWMWYPAGRPDIRFPFPASNMPDQTLVRTLLKVNALYLQTAQSATGQLTFGILPYESEDPEAVDGVIAAGGVLPDPFFTNQDWVIKVTYPVLASPTGFTGVTGLYQTLDKEFESRAMRKLPEGTGLLFVGSWNTNDGLPGVCSAGFSLHSNLAIKVPK